MKSPHHFDRLNATPDPVPRGEGMSRLWRLAVDGDIERELGQVK